MIEVIYWIAVVLITAITWGIVKHINFSLKQASGRTGFKPWSAPPMDRDEREFMDSTLGAGGWTWYTVRVFLFGLLIRGAAIVALIMFALWLKPDGFLSKIFG